MYFLLYIEVNHGFSRLFVTDTGTTIALDYRSRGPVSWFLVPGYNITLSPEVSMRFKCVCVRFAGFVKRFTRFMFVFFRHTGWRMPRLVIINWCTV